MLEGIFFYKKKSKDFFIPVGVCAFRRMDIPIIDKMKSLKMWKKLRQQGGLTSVIKTQKQDGETHMHTTEISTRKQ